MTKFQRSQAAHKRLINKYSGKKSTDRVSFLKKAYHSDVFRIQSERKKIISSDEKRYIYNVNEHFAFN